MVRRISVELNAIYGEHIRFEIPENAADIQIRLGYAYPYSVTYRILDSKDRVTCTVELL